MAPIYGIIKSCGGDSLLLFVLCKLRSMTASVYVSDQLKMKFLSYLRDCTPIILDGQDFEVCAELIRSKMGVCYLTSEEHNMIRSLIKYVNS